MNSTGRLAAQRVADTCAGEGYDILMDPRILVTYLEQNCPVQPNCYGCVCKATR